MHHRYGGDVHEEFGTGLGIHRDVYIEPINVHDDAYFNVHHYDPYKQHMPEGPTHVPYHVDHKGHVEVMEAEDHMHHYEDLAHHHEGLVHHHEDPVRHHDTMETVLGGIQEMPRFFLQ